MFIEYKNVNIYQGGKRVLGNVDFHVDEGEFVYIIGHVGSGKSSLLKTLYCELDIDEGDKAVVLERNLLKMKRKEVPALRKELGIIFQDFQLLHDRSVYKNLQFVLNFLKDSGLKVVGASEKASKFYTEEDLTVPVAIVMGAEDKGISAANLELCDECLRIPIEGFTASLNVSVAAGIMIYEVIRQRR